MTIDEAQKLAEQMHEGQFRADGVTPYIEHPKAVAAMVAENGGSEEDICVAWLHDIIEESKDKVGELIGSDMSNAIRFLMDAKKFGWDNKIIYSIKRLTDIWDQDYIKEMGKSAYLAKLLVASPLKDILVKLCDMICNMRESNGTRMTQEKNYYNAVKCLHVQNRKDMPENIKKLMCEVDSLYINHYRRNKKNGK